MADKIKIIRGTEGQWLTAESQGKILDLGEIAFITDTNELVVGDGTTSFSNLKRFLNKTQVATIDSNGFMSSSDKQFLEIHNDGSNNLFIDGVNDKIKLRRDIQANWEAVNPILDIGEIGVILDSNALVIGDGVTPFNELPNFPLGRPGFIWNSTLPSPELDRVFA